MMTIIYPDERMIYNKTVGRARVENIASILEELGFTVTIKEPENKDVDVWVYTSDRLVLVIEVLNWKKSCYLDFDRTQSIKDNLSNPDYSSSNRLLVFSFWHNIRNQLRSFEDLDIDYLEIGFQTQPMRYYRYFNNHYEELLCDMKPVDLTRQIVKEKLTGYLQQKDLL